MKIATTICLVYLSLSAYRHQAIASPDPTSRPNIVIVIADDQTWSDAGCYGNVDVNTPHIDSLAKEGLKFNFAFTATAMCSPTRQQLYTGLFPVRSGAYPNHSQVRKGTQSFVHYFNKAGYRVGLCGKRHIGPADSFPFTTVAKDNLAAFVANPEPFLLVYASNSPHRPWTAGDASQYDPQSLTLPSYIYDNQQTRTILADYYAEITDFDRELATVDQAVSLANKKDDTIFIYTSEQGAQFPYGKWTCYDIGLHVGFIMRWPNHIAANTQTDALVQYVDVVPTLLELCGIQIPADLDGRSFANVALGRKDKHQRYVYGVHTTRGIIQGSTSYPIRSVRTRQFKLILNLNHTVAFQNIVTRGDGNPAWASWVKAAQTDLFAKTLVDGYMHRPAVEFYNVVTDPLERTNLAELPQHQKEIARLSKVLANWMQQQGDQGHATEMLVKAHKSVAGE
ncbi:MAG: sulfatase [Planctomycetaceae bacterium]|jgi:N-sulfoglucosamine sulfohydrolase|nr:sulfatase [Planctomycetaceae bacterium]MBT5598346.1 sulfatase [Planctomycetaceae bacterium]